MKRRQGPKPAVVAALIVCGAVLVVWMGLLMGPAYGKGFFTMLEYFNGVMDRHEYFRIRFTKGAISCSSTLLMLYVACLGALWAGRRNYRHGVEHGSAKWGNAARICHKYRQKENKILTQNVQIGLDARKHRRNLNTLIIGGSGAGKTRFYAKPNLMNANTSFIVLDPKGELTRDTGYLLKEKGYQIRVLDLINMDKSDGYNPFVYLRDENDIQRLVTNLYKATTPKGSSSQDPFWDNAAEMLLMAIMILLYTTAPPEDQNFTTVLDLLRDARMENENDTSTVLDEMFKELAKEDPDNIAHKYYNNYRSGAGKTLQSVQITLAARLEKFNLNALARLTDHDDLHLDRIGTEKTVLYCIIPDQDKSFNFIVSMLYTQLFQRLIYAADHEYGGALPVPVHFLMDEFSNVALPDDFETNLSVIRSRQIFVSIILQNLAQLKEKFEKSWESIVGNCDTMLYLGGNEQSTHEYISKQLGKETIDTNTFGQSRGKNGSLSTNYQNTGRELLTPDEVRMLDNDYALLFIRGERPVMDLKYNILKHPDINLTADGKYRLTYAHGHSSYERTSFRIRTARDGETPVVEIRHLQQFLEAYDIYVYGSDEAV